MKRGPTAIGVSATGGGTILETGGHPFRDGFGDAQGYHFGELQDTIPGMGKAGFGEARV